MPATLTFAVYRGDRLLSRSTLDNPVIKIGRSTANQLAIDDALLSRVHAVIDNGGPGNITLVHLGEAPVPTIRGLPITERKLVTGNEIVIGNLRVVLEAIGGSESAPGASEARPPVLDELARRARAADAIGERRMHATEETQRRSTQRELMRTMVGAPENLGYVLAVIVTLVVLFVGGMAALHSSVAWGTGLLVIAVAVLLFIAARAFDFLVGREVAFCAGLPFGLEGYLAALSGEVTSSQHATVHVVFSGVLPPESTAQDVARAQTWQSRSGLQSGRVLVARIEKDRWVFDVDTSVFRANNNQPLRAALRRMLRESLVPLHAAYPIDVVHCFRPT